MRLRSVAIGTSLLGATAVSAAKSSLPVDKVYGTNLGSWLLVEPWMLPNEWVNKMGGDSCESDCSSCAYSEFDLVKKIGQERADKVFDEHWATWFTEKDADIIKNAGLNMIRIPLGYWIVESLVDRSTEYYPRGGMKYLKKGLGWLKKRGIHVMLDHHALPGVASANQMFAGRCTSDVQFYTPKNYKRALIWAGVMTAMTHTDPDWSSVFSIEAINEPARDANQTPGYGEYQKQYVQVVRLVEYALGVPCPDTDYTKIFPDLSYSKSYDKGLPAVAAHIKDKTIRDVLMEVHKYMKSNAEEFGLGSDIYVDIDVDVNLSLGASTSEVEKREPVEPVVPHGSSLERHNARRRLHHEHGLSARLGKDVCRTCLTTVFQNMHWQYNNPPNPADAANGPQAYDAHLYFAFGGVADPNPESYMKTICNTNRVARAKSVGNSPLVFGEWSVATNFNATPEFYQDWLDAQRTIYAGQADGWLFWSYKLEKGNRYVPDMSWSATYEAGYFTKDDPSKLKNPDVCKPWIANSTTTVA
ncbi:glycosyl hydrolase 5 (cellulase A) family [Rhizoctonia solani]|uniref:Glycosyl hydrolase 5 (Cellulase A) family n=1 Tax=Rhizoctonia solani TaxID=456999 RepID=A0A8H7H112_9AGAM|nr:glycosyl hydrolase 5 (cellulase A) family [Rhizoctonia solani]